VVNTYPHDHQAFTQGLAFEDGVLYEGTGLRGHSTLRRVDLETGTVRQGVALPPNLFGEGVTIYRQKIIQLTWQSHIGLVYNLASLEPQQTFEYPTEGWGITHDGKRLIMSDGTSTLHFLDPQTFKETHRIEVHDQNTPVVMLNELEYIHGEIFANVWQTDRIARIEPRTGQVMGWINLEGLLSAEDHTQPVDVLNGIAYLYSTDPSTSTERPNDSPAAHTAIGEEALPGRLFVTGKLWPKLFEIQLIPADTTSPAETPY
jgi:glutamine cyclotransferase